MKQMLWYLLMTSRLEAASWKTCADVVWLVAMTFIICPYMHHHASMIIIVNERLSIS